jgi:hypothetical protein
MNLIQTYNQLRQSPMQILTKRFNIPNSVNINDPNAIIQHLLNTNQVSQQQVNNFANLQGNPQMQQFINQLHQK